MSEIENNVPQHVGIIMDGNRRWAAARGLNPIDGHKKGYETFRSIADAALERGIRYMTVFAFSTENWQRAKDEVAFLLSFTSRVLKSEVQSIHERGIRFVWLGSEDGLDAKLVRQLREAEALTRHNIGGTFCYCFNYGGQNEIAEAAAAAAGLETVTRESITRHLYAPDVPDIDLIIRTSGEYRLSNFMLWRAAYSELYFVDTLWPDFGPEQLDVALEEYAHRQRRFGN